MAVPQRKTSKARRDKRRAQWRAKFKPAGFSICPNCQEPKLPHRVCPHCGFYRERQVIEVEEY